MLRLALVETLILLCTTRAGRDRLRESGVYEIVKIMHLSEQDEKVCESTIVTLRSALTVVLFRDEDCRTHRTTRQLLETR